MKRDNELQRLQDDLDLKRIVLVNQLGEKVERLEKEAAAFRVRIAVLEKQTGISPIR